MKNKILDFFNKHLGFCAVVLCSFLLLCGVVFSLFSCQSIRDINGDGVIVAQENFPRKEVISK